jgi:hypothetical protein
MALPGVPDAHDLGQRRDVSRVQQHRGNCQTMMRKLAFSVLFLILSVIALFLAASYHDSNLAAWQNQTRPASSTNTEELHK